jgi:iron complex outermembrane receptor protein
MGNGLAPETLKERNGGGLPYTYPDGSTANHGVILEGVFDDGKANTDVVHYMYKYAGVYAAWSDIHMPRSAAVFENSWMKLRELSLSYEVPQTFVTRTKVFQGLNVSLIGRDLFYLFTTLPDKLNPEAISGARNAQGLQWAGYPGIRSFGVSVRARF